MTIAFAAAFTGRYVTNLKKFQELFARPGLFLPSLNPVPFTGVFLNALECRECKPLLSAARLAPRPGRAGVPCVPAKKKRKKDTTRFGLLLLVTSTLSHTHKRQEACHC